MFVGFIYLFYMMKKVLSYDIIYKGEVVLRVRDFIIDVRFLFLLELLVFICLENNCYRLLFFIEYLYL